MGGFNVCRLKVRCSLETMWVCWDFVKWLEPKKGQPKEVFPVTLENFAKRQDTVHQIKLARSPVDYNVEGPAG